MGLPASLIPFIKASGLNVKKSTPVSGGDINDTFCVETGDSKYFLKLNDIEGLPEMFTKEGEGLILLKQAGCLAVPRVFENGVCGRQQYLLMEWIEAGKADKQFWQSFGEGLACLHRKTNTQFGWAGDNYIGSLKQRNDWRKTWAGFYAEMRIMPLVEQLVDRGDFSYNDLRLAEKLCLRFGSTFPQESPALLHGDLWSGNFMVSDKGVAVLFDPAVYYGHREMDLGMSKLFGGFERAFYDAYHACYPLEKNWEKRLAYPQLYPLLVHALLFGGPYVQRCRNTITAA
jgi:fructosamine-3-kinase